MKRLQQWFDLIAGISHDQQTRLERARAIFGASCPDVDALKTPACWRRRARVVRR